MDPLLLVAVHERFWLAQAVLLPLVLLEALWLPGRATLRLRWAIHRALVLLVIVLPIGLLLPGANRLQLPAVMPPGPAAPVEPALPSPAADNAVSAFEPHDAPGALPATAAGRAAYAAGDRSPLWPWFVSGGASVLSFLGLVGLGITFATGLAHDRRLRRRAETLRRIGRLRVIRSAEVRVPYSAGVLFPSIYLPARPGWTSRMEAAAFAHEAEHVRGSHSAWSLLERLVASLVGIFPLGFVLARSGRLTREIQCDARASIRTGRSVYARLLVEAAEAIALRRQFAEPTSGWIGRGLLTDRVAALLRTARERTRLSGLAALPIALVLGLAVLLSLTPRLPTLDAQQKETRPESLIGQTSLPPLISWNMAGATTITVTSWPSPQIVDGEGPGSFGSIALTGSGRPRYPYSTGATGWNLGTGEMFTVWADTARRRVLGVYNPAGFALSTTRADGVTVTQFDRDIRSILSGIMLHLPFLQNAYMTAGGSGELGTRASLFLDVARDGRIAQARYAFQTGDGRLGFLFAGSMRSWDLTYETLGSDYGLYVPFIVVTRDGDTRLRMGDAVSPVPGWVAWSFPFELVGDWLFREPTDRVMPRIGTFLLACKVSPDGSLADVSVLDTDIVDKPTVDAAVSRFRNSSRWTTNPSGRTVTVIFLLSREITRLSDPVRKEEISYYCFAWERDALRYFEHARGLPPGLGKLELPPGFLTNMSVGSAGGR